MKLDQIYTFYINGVDPDEGIWGCVAKSEEEAIKEALHSERMGSEPIVRPFN
jgi:hypothetical protein